jgi:hypothetical protein
LIWSSTGFGACRATPWISVQHYQNMKHWGIARGANQFNIPDAPQEM